VGIRIEFSFDVVNCFDFVSCSETTMGHASNGLVTDCGLRKRLGTRLKPRSYKIKFFFFAKI
jgi:hypothetical protein